MTPVGRAMTHRLRTFTLEEHSLLATGPYRRQDRRKEWSSSAILQIISPRKLNYVLFSVFVFVCVFFLICQVCLPQVPEGKFFCRVRRVRKPKMDELLK